MPRPARPCGTRRRRARHRARCVAAAAALAALAAPAPAQAARYSVRSGGGACGGTDTTCGTLAAAARALRAGDALTIAPGRYHESPRFAAAGLVIRGSKTAPGVVVDGTVTFDASGAPSSLEKLAVRASAPGAAAVVVSGPAGVAVRDASLFSADGNALTIAAASGNAVARSRLLAQRAAVAIGGGSLALDSSILSGGPGADGAGVAAVPSPEYALLGGADIVARHVTIAGAPAAIVLGDTARAAVSDSIVLGSAPAGVAFTRTDRESAPAALFVNPATRNFRLRRGSPAVDRGQLEPGDSRTDIDGQPRTLGPASDLGADELDSVAPQVTITRPRAGRALAAGGRLRLAGRAQDPSRVASVVFSLEVLPSAGGRCRWFHPRRALVTRSCTDPVRVRARLAAGGGRWSYDGPRRLPLPAGRYRVRAFGTDRAGVFGNSAPARRASVTFRVGRAAEP